MPMSFRPSSTGAFVPTRGRYERHTKEPGERARDDIEWKRSTSYRAPNALSSKQLRSTYSASYHKPRAVTKVQRAAAPLSSSTHLLTSSGMFSGFLPQLYPVTGGHCPCSASDGGLLLQQLAWFRSAWDTPTAPRPT